MSALSRDLIAQIVAKQNLELIGIVAPNPPETYEAFRVWLSEKKHAGMDYLERWSKVRADPRYLLAGARSIIVVGFNYFLGKEDYRQPKARVAQYSRFRDYHKLLKKKARAILDDVMTQALTRDHQHTGRVLIDSAPILERAFAAQGMHGFVGKNTLYIHPHKGSFFLLGEIITTVDIEVDESAGVDPTQRTESGGCGSCRRCQLHCPTGALDNAYSLDANLCLSYWSIEHRGVIPYRFWPWFKHYYFGCDICQMVCPYNRGVELSSEHHELRLNELPELEKIAQMDQGFYEKVFGGTPLTRAKRSGLRRNAIIAMAALDHPKLSSLLPQLEKDLDQVVAQTAQMARKWQNNT